VSRSALERRGTLPDGYEGSEESTHFSIPTGELDALDIQD
jgi:hypothetical protein